MLPKKLPCAAPVSGEPLEYRDLPPFDPDQIDSHNPGHWRYLPMLPVVAEGRELYSLGEGWTPLIEDVWLEQPVFWKFEGLMPSGSYKDRGVSVIINWLVGQGARTVMDDSSGNAGASLACYAARAGLYARIFVPAYAPQPKKAQIAVYGAELVEVSGARAAATEAAEASQTGDDVVYASHAWHPACLLGFMTNAWEIWEQLGRKVPDWFVTPVGYGGLFLGAWRGFQHLHRSGIIEKLPRMVAVQAEPITPICDAFHEGHSEVVPRRQVTPSILGRRHRRGKAGAQPLDPLGLAPVRRHSHRRQRRGDPFGPGASGPARAFRRTDQRHGRRRPHETGSPAESLGFRRCQPDRPWSQTAASGLEGARTNKVKREVSPVCPYLPLDRQPAWRVCSIR